MAAARSSSQFVNARRSGCEERREQQRILETSEMRPPLSLNFAQQEMCHAEVGQLTMQIRGGISRRQLSVQLATRGFLPLGPRAEENVRVLLERHDADLLV